MKYLLCVDGYNRDCLSKILNFVTKEDEIFFVSVYPPHPEPNENVTIGNSTLAKMVIEMFSGLPDLVDPEEESKEKNEQIIKSNKKKVAALNEFNYFKSHDIANKCNVHYLLVASQDVSHSITKVADQYKVDCVVLGSSSESGYGIQKLFLGSISSQVLQMAHCSVLISR